MNCNTTHYRANSSSVPGDPTARLAKRDKKPRYLAHLPRVWRYMEQDLQHPKLAALKLWYDRTIPKEARGALDVELAGAAS